MRHIFGSFLLVFSSATMVVTPLVQAQHVTKIQASQLVTNGESFFAGINDGTSTITQELTKLARTDGYIGSNESFKSVSVAGTSISQILDQYKKCNPKPTYLVSDGGGIDLMGGRCSNADCQVIKNCANTLKDYLAEMKKNGTKKLLWMIYPDAGMADLKANQDIWAQEVPKIMATCTDPKVLLVDLRKTWNGHPEYTKSDGIHCTNAGAAAAAGAFWKAMKENYFFDLETPVTQPYAISKVASSAILCKVVGNGNVAVSLSVDQPSNIALRLMTASGRSVYSAQQQTAVSGNQTVMFSLQGVAQGVYFSEVKAGGLTRQSTLLVP